MDDKVSLDFATISAALRGLRLPAVDCVMGIADGGVVPASLLAHQLALPLYLLRINYRSPDNSPQRPAPELLSHCPDLPPGVRVLLVDDVSVSGQTMALARQLLAPHPVVTLCLKGQADYVIFPDIKSCVNWPWAVTKS